MQITCLKIYYAVVLSQVFLIFNKSSMCIRICDLLHEICFRLWNLYKERNEKRRTTFEFSLVVNR